MIRKLKCSFCARSQHDVERLLGGPKVHICDDCVSACNKILQATPAKFQGWENLSEKALLSGLKIAETTVNSTRSVLQSQVDELRRREVSWQKIADALSVSRQAAWERFS